MKTMLLALLLSMPVVVIVDWQALVSMSFWFVVWAGAPAIGLALLVGGRVGKRTALVPYGVGLIASGVLGGLLAGLLNRQQTARNQDLGERVAAALEAHRAAHGSYPEGLAHLVPDQLAELPEASVGPLGSRPFYYVAAEQPGKFTLGYEAMRGIAAFRTNGEWVAVPLPW